VPASPALTQVGLERVRRDMARLHPGTEAYGLISTCHPRSGVDLIYTGKGMLVVWCHRCHREVAVLHVAYGPLRGGQDEAYTPPATSLGAGDRHCGV
jgi:hypothetical protein